MFRKRLIFNSQKEKKIAEMCDFNGSGKVHVRKKSAHLKHLNVVIRPTADTNGSTQTHGRPRYSMKDKQLAYTRMRMLECMAKST